MCLFYSRRASFPYNQSSAAWKMEQGLVRAALYVLSPMRCVRAPCDAYERTVYSTVCRATVGSAGGWILHFHDGLFVVE